MKEDDQNGYEATYSMKYGGHWKENKEICILEDYFYA